MKRLITNLVAMSVVALFAFIGCSSPSSSGASSSSGNGVLDNTPPLCC